MNLPARFCSFVIRVLLVSGSLLIAFPLIYFLSTQIISAFPRSLYSTKITPDGRFKAEIWLDPMLTFTATGSQSDGTKPVRVYFYEVSTGKQLNTSKSGIVTNSEYFDVNIDSLENWNGVQLPKSQDPNILLINAAIKGDVSEFNKLLPHITPQFRTSHNRTAIHAAVMGKNLQILEKLLQKNIDTNVRDTDGITALEIATETGDTKAVKLLLKYGANANVSRVISPKFNDSSQDTRTVTPLLSVLENLNNTELAGILIANGASVNVRGKYKMTPLHLVTSDIIIIDRLLKKGADINAQDAFGNTPMFYAIINKRGNSLEVSKLLIERGAKVNIANKAGQTPLMLAASLSDEVQSNPEQRQTTQKLRLDLIQLLIANGADVNTKNKDGKTVFDDAYNSKVREYLKQQLNQK